MAMSEGGWRSLVSSSAYKTIEGLRNMEFDVNRLAMRPPVVGPGQPSYSMDIDGTVTEHFPQEYNNDGWDPHATLKQEYQQEYVVEDPGFLRLGDPVQPNYTVRWDTSTDTQWQQEPPKPKKKRQSMLPGEIPVDDEMPKCGSCGNKHSKGIERDFNGRCKVTLKIRSQHLNNIIKDRNGDNIR